MKKGPLLIIKDVSHNFGSTKVLSNISFTVDEGDFLGVIGPNGSGKTTLIKIVLGLYPLQKGSIVLLGEDIRRFSRWHDIGYVPQKAVNFDPFFPATVREIVAMGMLSKKGRFKIMNPSDYKKVDDALATVGMQDHSQKRIGELSGGQQQRVFIARAIVSDPKVLFLDEPTAGVDQKTQDRFYNLLNDLNKTRGISIILVTHDIGRITGFVTKIASLNQKLVFYGEHKDFCAQDAEHVSSEDYHKLCLHGG